MEQNNEIIRYKKCVFRETKEHQLDVQLNLPDYYPDVCRILTCQVIPFTENCTQDASRITVDGIAVIRLLYCSEEKSLHLFETEMRFSKNAEPSKITPSSLIDCKLSTVSTSYRAIGPRRVDVKTTVSLTVELSELTQLNVETQFQDHVECLIQEYELFDISACYCGSFVIDEEFSLRDDRIAQSRLLHDNNRTVISDIKTVKDKILIKGYAELNLTYLYPKDNTVFKYYESVPFSQIIDIYGLNESDKCSVLLDPQRLSLTVKDSGECEAKLTVRACVCAGNIKTVGIAKDLYSAVFNTRIRFNEEMLQNSMRSFADNFLCSSQAEKTESNELQIVSADQTDLSFTAALENGKITASGRITVGILAIANDEMQLLTRYIPFEYSRDADTVENGQLTVNVYCKSIVCNKTSQGIVIKAEIEINGFYVNSEKIRFVDHYELAEKSAKDEAFEIITLYFAEAGESVWDIAKKNRIPLQVLKSTNELSNDTIESEKVLILIGSEECE